ncbi:MAG: hypothetical protein AB7T18_12085 [Alphaproteobacteria bacterium]
MTDAPPRKAVDADSETGMIRGIAIADRSLGVSVIGKGRRCGRGIRVLARFPRAVTISAGVSKALSA